MIPLDDSQSTRRFPIWTVLIILINLYVFYLQLTTDSQTIIDSYALTPSLVDINNHSSLIPLITSQFLHGGFIHIISNMLFLWVFGDNVEERFGFIFFPIIYLLSGIVGGVGQYLLDPNSPIPMLGASGAVAGVLGAYLVLFPHHSIKTLVPLFGFFSIVNVPAQIMLVYWFITQFFAGVLSISTTAQAVGGVAYLAHIGGFLTGFIAARLIQTKSNTY